MRLSLILPVLNERENLERNFPRIYSALKRLGTFEIIIAENGGSSDGTRALAERLSRQPHVRFISLRRAGRGGALKKAISIARGRTIGYVDIDLAVPVRYIGIAVKAVERGNAVVFGSRYERGSHARRSPKRYIASITYNAMVNLLLESAIRDHQCGFKFWDANFIKSAAPKISDSHWFFDTEMLILAQREGASILALPVLWNEQKDSKVKGSDVVYYTRIIMKSRSARLGYSRS